MHFIIVRQNQNGIKEDNMKQIKCKHKNNNIENKLFKMV